jgi:hypothetical protein
MPRMPVICRTCSKLGTAACDPDLAAETVAAFNFAFLRVRLRFVVHLISEFRTDQCGAGVRAPGSPPPACSLGAPLRVADAAVFRPVSSAVSVIEAGPAARGADFRVGRLRPRILPRVRAG